jgi:ribosomal protein S18 acetylase RimI-like enzyme
MPSRDIRIESAGAGDVDDLRELFLAMHHHHWDIVGLPLVADDAAWDARRAQYLAWLAEGRATLLVARGDDEPAGYAFVIIHVGTDDTFPLAPRYAELYSLSVAPDMRGRGVGGQLLDAVDAELLAQGDLPLVLCVMTGNTDALRLYSRRGLEAGEIVMYRFPASTTRLAHPGSPGWSNHPTTP